MKEIEDIGCTADTAGILLTIFYSDKTKLAVSLPTGTRVNAFTVLAAIETQLGLPKGTLDATRNRYTVAFMREFNSNID